MIQSKIKFFEGLDGFVELTSHSDAQISRFGDFCADKQMEKTNCFTPCCACVRGVFIGFALIMPVGSTFPMKPNWSKKTATSNQVPGEAFLTISGSKLH